MESGVICETRPDELLVAQMTGRSFWSNKILVLPKGLDCLVVRMVRKENCGLTGVTSQFDVVVVWAPGKRIIMQGPLRSENKPRHPAPPRVSLITLSHTNDTRHLHSIAVIQSKWLV